MKYSEGKILCELQSYLASTYGQHYVGEDNVQVMDLVGSLGHGRSFAIGNIIKYASNRAKSAGRSAPTSSRYCTTRYSCSTSTKRKVRDGGRGLRWFGAWGKNSWEVGEKPTNGREAYGDGRYQIRRYDEVVSSCAIVCRMT